MQVVADSITSAKQLRQHLARRRRESGIPARIFDELLGLAPGYSAKLECGMRGFGEVSLPAYLSALGLKLVLVESGERPPRAVRTFLQAG